MTTRQIFGLIVLLCVAVGLVCRLITDSDFRAVTKSLLIGGGFFFMFVIGWQMVTGGQDATQ